MSRTDVLVDAGWVQAHLGDPGVVLVKVIEDTAYGKGHISGAVRLGWRKDLHGPVKRDFVDRAGFETLLAERGIADDDTVILCGGSRRSAAYAYWYFKDCGHRDVRLFDGDYKKWELDSRAMVTEAWHRPPAAPGHHVCPLHERFPCLGLCHGE